ncbi:methyltransferase N6AMT1-like [Hylaeus volcanicus]|uniref:methyltransferase N6AMT1-like n=1 Tax=Hylaeus volcanicus TaxID=313075 RepID=UPI0023B87992|nr:methyltransferase N6AMT1-like [Hylaeus volcanicus]
MPYPTPLLDHITTRSEFRNNVYDPSEDTFLFLDALEKDIDFIKQIKPSIVVDLGCGSGCLGVFLLQILSTNSSSAKKNTLLKQEDGMERITDKATKHSLNNLPFIIGIDINHTACIAASCTSQVNNVSCNYDTFVGNLTDNLRPYSADVILFNPPYVPSKLEDVAKPCITAAWAGGINGSSVIHEFISLLPTCLSKTGCAYILLEQRNSFENINKHFKSLGFDLTIILEKRRRNEHLFIIKCTFQK